MPIKRRLGVFQLSPHVVQRLDRQERRRDARPPTQKPAPAAVDAPGDGYFLCICKTGAQAEALARALIWWAWEIEYIARADQPGKIIFQFSERWEASDVSRLAGALGEPVEMVDLGREADFLEWTVIHRRAGEV